MLFPYALFRISLRILGKVRRQELLARYWPNRFSVPTFFPFALRRAVSFKGWLEEMDSRHDAEPKVIEQMSRMRGELFVDVGANVGYYTRLLAGSFNQIIAVEADPVIYEHLRKRVRENSKVILAAVTDSDRPIDFRRDSGFEEINDNFTVHGMTLARLLSGVHFVDLVKVDVEGGEFQVIEGSKVIMRRIRSWIIELHELRRAVELERLMEQFNYVCRWLDCSHAFFELGVVEGRGPAEA
jgi:FkbM family methyltransferase